MKKILLLSLIFMTACASKTTMLPEEKGTACMPLKKGETVTTCYPGRLYTDPTRFNYLRPWQEKALGDMPDLP